MRLMRLIVNWSTGVDYEVELAKEFPDNTKL